jgi:hypothetical protein
LEFFFAIVIPVAAQYILVHVCGTTWNRPSLVGGYLDELLLELLDDEEELDEEELDEEELLLLLEELPEDD